MGGETYVEVSSGGNDLLNVVLFLGLEVDRL